MATRRNGRAGEADMGASTETIDTLTSAESQQAGNRRTCLTCGAVFVPRRPEAQYCAPPCWAEEFTLDGFGAILRRSRAPRAASR